MPLVTSRQRLYASLHISLALVHLSAHLAGDRTHSTLAYDLWYTEIVFRVHLYRAIQRKHLHPIVSRASRYVGRPVVLNVYLSLSLVLGTYYDTSPGAALVSLAIDGTHFSNHQRWSCLAIGTRAR